MYLRSVVGIISILFYGLNCVNCEDEDSFGKVLIGLFLRGFFAEIEIHFRVGG